MGKRSLELKKKFKNFLKLSLIWILLLAGCQTIAWREDVSVPEEVYPAFSSCTSGEGGVLIQAGIPGAELYEVYFEWVSDRNKLGYQAELTDLLGGKIAGLSGTNPGGATFNFIGAPQLSPLVVNKRGYLLWNGDMIGIKHHELFCLAEFKLPEEWLLLPRSLEQSQSGWILYTKDSARTMKITILKKSGKLSQIFAEITVGYFLGLFKKTLVFSLFPHKGNGFTKVGNKTTITWKKSDGV